MKSFTRSFAGGEVSPQLYGRIDLVKFQTGLAKCLNFIVTPQGPVFNRPGFAYVNRCRYDDKQAVAMPFAYSTQQTFALEVGDQYIRFHTNGATLLETAKVLTGITQAVPGVFTSAGHGFANGKWVYLTGILGMTALNGRWGVVFAATANTFSLLDLFGNVISTAALSAYTSGGTVSAIYEIATPYLEADLFDLHYVQSADVLTITHPDYVTRELRRLGATNWTLTTVSFVPTITTPAVPTATQGGPGGGTPEDVVYVTTAIATDTLEESLASPTVTQNVDLTVDGNYVDITPAAVAVAVRFNVFKRKSGIYGFIGQTDGTAFRDNNIAPDLSKTPPLAFNPFATENPGTVSYYDQRRAFAGGGTSPQSTWMTRPATESNMTYSIPTQDDDAIRARIVAREANVIRHLVPLNDLIALTSGGVWRISSSDGGALTPATFSVKPQSYIGASNAQPVVTSASVLYVADRGAHIREVGYKWESQRYDSEDASVLAPHLFDYESVVQLAYSRSPVQILWGVRGDGLLLGMTHVPEHEVKAWHKHDTAGLFESVCTVAEGSEDGVYVIVQRTIGTTDVRHIERMHSRQFDTIADAFFVDAGVTYSGTAATAITGLWHLEGETVTILADGGVEPSQVVASGSVTLQAQASTVHVGLAYNSDLQTLPLSYETAGMGQGLPKNVTDVHLRVDRSSNVQVGPTFEDLIPYKQRTTEPYGSPPDLVTDVISIKPKAAWQENASVCVRQDAPLPLTVLSMTLETATGG